MKRVNLRAIFRSHEFKCIVYIILMACAWIGIASDFYRLIPSETLEWMNRIYLLFNNNIWLNIPTCSLLLYLFYKLYSNTVYIGNFHFHWFFAIAFVYLILYYQSPYDYAIIIWRIDYRLFLSILLGFVLLGMLMAFDYDFRFSFRWKRWPSVGHIKGFSPDKRKESVNLSLPIEAYVNVIEEKLRATDLGYGYDSFAIGITSEWGTGKTTFLRRLKDEIHLKMSRDIVDFNPWMCQSAEQVTKDFFSTLRNSLSQRHPALSSPINKYARQLRSITVPVFGNISFKLTPYISDKSLLEMKHDLSEEFSKLKEPVVVVIDDLDRLDSSEVFEVLRLIRNTADLSNMIYLVAYDKNYIIKILENQHISDPVAYLEKIFQLEIQLPLVSDDSVWTTLLESLRNQLPKDTDISFIEEQKDLIKEILNSYRRAKRFARLFSLDFDYLKRESVNKLNLKEKFLLDLLQMDDKEIYDILWNKPEKLLRQYKTVQEVKIWEYSIPKNQQLDKDIIILNDGTHIKPTTHKLLSRLWPDTSLTPNIYSIRYVEYLAEYFTMKVQFSQKHVKQIIESNLEDVDALMERWTGKVHRSNIIIENIIEYNKTKNPEEQQKKKLIWAALSDYYYTHDSSKVDIIRKLVTKENDTIVIDWFKKKLEKKECIYEGLLSLLQSFDEEVINHENVETIIKSCMQHFINNSNCSILDCIQTSKTDTMVLFWGIYSLNANNRKIAFKELIDIYSQMEQKPTMEEYDKIELDIVKDKDNRLVRIFKDDWERYLGMIQQKCIEPIKSSE